MPEDPEDPLLEAELVDEGTLFHAVPLRRRHLFYLGSLTAVIVTVAVIFTQVVTRTSNVDPVLNLNSTAVPAEPEKSSLEIVCQWAVGMQTTIPPSMTR